MIEELCQFKALTSSHLNYIHTNIQLQYFKQNIHIFYLHHATSKLKLHTQEMSLIVIHNTHMKYKVTNMLVQEKNVENLTENAFNEDCIIYI